MITSVDISSKKYAIDESTRNYVMEKLGRLDRYLPRHARLSVTADVKLNLVNRDHGNKYEAEAILMVPDKTLTAKESTTTMLAAIDMVEAKLLAQLHKYKQAHMHRTAR